MGHRARVAGGRIVNVCSTFSHFIDSKSAGAYTRRGQLSWLGVALRARSARSQVKIEAAVDGLQFLGKAVKIGHGPATVIGCSWDAHLIFRSAPGGQVLRIRCCEFAGQPFESATGGFSG